jgi:hypothetical protein
MGYLRTVLVAGMVAATVGGCGSGSAPTATAGAQIESGSCESSGAGGRVTSQSCSFVLSDGEQFRCHKAFEGSTPTAPVLEHVKGCVRLTSLVLSPAVRRMIAALDKARRCLSTKGIRAIGGPVLPPNPSASSSPDGELVVGQSAAHALFIAYYTSAARAQRLQAGLKANARRITAKSNVTAPSPSCGFIPQTASEQPYRRARFLDRE